MTVSWKSAIVRVAQDASSIQRTITERMRQGWLLQDQCTCPETGKVDLVFRAATTRRV